MTSLVASCANDTSGLFLELRTDYVPGIEFVYVRVATSSASHVLPPIDTPALHSADYATSARRVAEIPSLTPGDYTVIVELRDLDDVVIGSRRVLALVQGRTSVLAVIVACTGGGPPRRPSSMR